MLKNSGNQYIVTNNENHPQRTNPAALLNPEQLWAIEYELLDIPLQ